MALQSVALPLSVQLVHIRAALFRYPVDEAMLRAILVVENGRAGLEAGLNYPQARSMKSGDLAAFADPTCPDGAEQHFRLARRMVTKTGQWIFMDKKRREQFMEWWAADYLRGGTTFEGITEAHKAKENYKYFSMIQKCYKQEHDYLVKRGKEGGYQPWLWDLPVEGRK